MNNLKEIMVREGVGIAKLSRLAKLSAATVSKLYHQKKRESSRDVTKGAIVKAINDFVGFEKYIFDDVFPV